jgi:hypothetical protein
VQSNFIKTWLFQLIIAIICSQSANPIFSQSTKGVVTETNAAASISAGKGNVYAMIAGISNYPFVKPLNFAEEDALLFLEFLRSDAGGNVPENHIKLLLNEQATHANVTSGLAWLDKNTGLSPEAGDRVYIYLSGHGDAYDASEAYYLCYDSNPAGDKNNYQLGGALDIGKMKKRLGTMVSKGVEVILIVDACRSGDVPGVKAGIGNPYQSVIEAPVGEILLLAAGPNQFALEDRRWGGGHGSFTWYLVKGLSGEADSDGDGIVQLFEIQNYTQMKVIGDTRLMGAPQTPYICCNGKFDFPLAKKDETFAKRIKAEESGNTKVGLTAMAARDAMENALFENEQLKTTYFDIKKKCQQQKYLGSGSAWELWEQCLKAYPKKDLEPIRMYLMGALAAEGQKAINQEMSVNVENTPSYDYYKERRKWVEHAILLQQEKNEVMGIEGVCSFLKALELCHSVSFAIPSVDSIFYTVDDQVYFEKRIAPFEKADSIFTSLEKEFSKSAMYHYMVQAHLYNREVYYLEDNTNERKKHLLKAMELAPQWAKPTVTGIEMKLFPKQDILENLTERIKTDSSNADNYFLNFKYFNNFLPIQRAIAMENLEIAMNMRPSTALTERVLRAKFPHVFSDHNILLSTPFKQLKSPTEKDWKEIMGIISNYHKDGLHRSECYLDSANLIRTMIPAIVGLGIKLNHLEEVRNFLAHENSVCPSFDGYLCESIIQQYILNNKDESELLDQKAMQITTDQTVLLDLFGIDKDKLPKNIQVRALYQSSKLLNLLLFGKDQWITQEMTFLDTLSIVNDEMMKLNNRFKTLLRIHNDPQKLTYEIWNNQLDLIRKEFKPDFLNNIIDDARLLKVSDSLVIFLRDEKLKKYLGLNFSLDLALNLMQTASFNNVDYADSVLIQVYQSLGNNIGKMTTFLSSSKLNQMFINTLSFQTIYGNPTNDWDRMFAFQLYFFWGLSQETEKVFNSFAWDEPGEINAIVLATLTDNCIAMENFPLAEKCLNRIIPYVYSTENQDYSVAASIINQFLFYKGQFLTNGIYQSPEFKRLYDKYVVN